MEQHKLTKPSMIADQERKENYFPGFLVGCKKKKQKTKGNSAEKFGKLIVPKIEWEF